MTNEVANSVYIVAVAHVDKNVDSALLVRAYSPKLLVLSSTPQVVSSLFILFSFSVNSFSVGYFTLYFYFPVFS